MEKNLKLFIFRVSNLISLRIDYIIRGFASGKGGIASLILGIMSIFSTLIIFFYSGWNLQGIKTIYLGAVMLLFLIAISIIVVWRSLYKLPPDEFARIIISGQSASKIFQILALQIWTLCHRFTQNSKVVYLNHFFLSVKTNDQNLISIEEFNKFQITLAQNSSKIKKCIKRLRILYNKNNVSLRRLNFMKMSASEILGIPVRSFCDYILQYSPTIHRLRFEKFIENWEEIINNYQRMENKRISKLLNENEHIYKKFASRIDYQKQLLKYKDLHHYIKRFAGNYSNSRSVRAYGNAISAVAKELLEKFESKKIGLDFNSPLYVECCRKLQFLYYKQRAHYGFDLNYSCLQLLRKRILMAKKSEFSRINEIQRYERLIKILERLRVNKTYRNNLPFDTQNQQLVKVEINDLAYLGHDIDIALEQFRIELIYNFKMAFEDWFLENSPSKKYILISGYSETILEVMKIGLKQISEDVKVNNLPQDNPINPLSDFEQKKLIKKCMPQIVLMKPLESAHDENFIMEYELKEGETNPVLKDARTGDEGLIINLIENNSKIMIILGVECFDNVGRVLHSTDENSKRLSRLKSYIAQHKNNVEFTVVAIAEAYKHHARLVEIQELNESLNQLHLYEPGLIDLVITNDLISKDGKISLNIQDGSSEELLS